VRTDALGAVLEPDTRANNDSAPRTLTLVSPYADLAVEAAVGPASALSGSRIDVAYRVRNLGDSTTNATQWKDRIYLSADALFDASDVALGDVLHTGALAAGDSYSALATVTLPEGISGSFQLFVATDVEDAVFERAFNANNIGKSVAPIAVSLAPAPDLMVSDVTAPAQAQPGQLVSLSWTVTNTGEAAARAPWTDRVYVSADGTLTGAVLLGEFTRSTGVEQGATYTRSADVAVPDLADGSYRLVVATDAAGQVFEQGREANNTATSAALAIVHPDLTPLLLTTPGSAVSGDSVSLGWSVKNAGSGDTGGSWIDRLYLSRDALFDGSDVFLGEQTHSGGLAAGATYDASLTAALPLGASGDYFVLLRTDAGSAVRELGAESNNTIATGLSVALAPYADLAVSNVTAPTQTIADPARVTIGWTVTNVGTGAGRTSDWVDSIIASRNGQETLLAEFPHSGAMQVGDSYSRSETIFLPPAFVGRYTLLVRADGRGAVFENGSEANNTGAAPNVFDVMPIPYADLQVTSLAVPATGRSGQALHVQWTVANLGIGPTDGASWGDIVTLAANADGSNAIAGYGFDHIGVLAPGGSYVRAADLTVPNGVSGTYYVVVRTGGPFEFVHDDNNTAAAGPVTITLAPSPDLVVTNIVAPASADEGDLVDLSWTVRNNGDATAAGGWTDVISLRKSGDPSVQPISLGAFNYTAELEANKEYTRTERFRLPSRIEGAWQVVVSTNVNKTLYEQGAAATNNTTPDDQSLLLSLKPRPDLQVQDIAAPDRVAAGATAAVEFTIVNRGSVAAQGHWKDNVYLSVDNKAGGDDILIGSLDNGAALGPSESYRSQTSGLIIPERFAGDGFILVVADASGSVDEYPNEANNVIAKPIYVTPIPPADLVASGVVAPPQGVYGGEIEVRYTVTNLGSGETDRANWSDTVWLTRDKTRPNPGGNGGILLGTFSHAGRLQVGDSYEQTVHVRIPDQIESGIYYITAWADAYDAVLESTFANNINPDDPNEIDNNNYKARAIDIIGTPIPPLPDLRPFVAVDATGDANAPYTVTWTVRNAGEGPASGNWIDVLLLSDLPDFTAPGAHVWYLGGFGRPNTLDSLAEYTVTKSFDLSPATTGHYVTVVTDWFDTLRETKENNNVVTASTEVATPAADLRVVSIQSQPQNFSGERTTISWTVRNDGGPIWQGTRLWSDQVWISPDPTFIPYRAVSLGSFVHGVGTGLAHGETYTQNVEVTLPAGIGGDYFLYVFPDYAGDRGLDGQEDTPSGNIVYSRPYYGGHVWEDGQGNNLARGDIKVIYREPDLQVTSIAAADSVESGSHQTATFTVTNVGNRATRQDRWIDRVYLSSDPSLDTHDLQIGEIVHYGALAEGASYSQTISFDVPEGASGRYYLIGFADSDVMAVGQTGHGAPTEVGEVRLLSDAVPEFANEGNNTTVRPLDVVLRAAPDLRVTSVVIPERIKLGETFALSYTVTNVGAGDVPATQSEWLERIYFSADQFLDPNADRFIEEVHHTGALVAGASYTVTRNVKLPRELIGPYYAFVWTDVPDARQPRGVVYEASHENNNTTPSPDPLLVELPPPSDLQVVSIDGPASAVSGQPFSATFTITNAAGVAASGSWADAVYLSEDSTWDLDDRLLGRVTHTGTLAVGDSYTATLNGVLPPAKAGQYRLIVRPDIFNDVYEGVDERNNFGASQDAINVSVEELHLGVPLDATLSPGELRLYRIAVGGGDTLRVTLDSSDDDSQNELYVRYNALPSGSAFDAASEDPIAADQKAFIPSTLAGDYYVLVQGRSGSRTHVPVRLVAETLPFQITDVKEDQGGDSRWVTFTIRGAGFKPDALVKLVRPGIAEFEPARYQVIDATRIIATFDFRGAEHGLYDVKVINPNGDQAIVPYRYLVERAMEIDATIGLGGPRVVPAGQAGLYGITLQSLTNVDTPYVYFEFGAPDIGDNGEIFGLPFVTFNSNVRGAPDGVREDVGWASLDSEVNTDGFMMAPGYALDVTAGGFVGMSFTALTYAGLKEIGARDFAAFQRAVYDARPDLAATHVYDTLASLTGKLKAIFTDPNSEILDRCQPLYIPFRFNVFAAATPMTRAEFVERQSAEAEKLRVAILGDVKANAALVNLAADAQAWKLAHLAALEESGLLRPEDVAPPIRLDPKVISTLAVLASGVLVGPAGQEIVSPSSLSAFFAQVHKWYGDKPRTMAPIAGYDVRGSEDGDCPEYDIPIPALPTFEQHDLGLTHPTYFETFNIFSPWLGFTPSGELPDFASVAASSDIKALDLQALFEAAAGSNASAAMSGPEGVGPESYVPANTALPYTIRFENPSTATTTANEVRIVANIDENLNPRSFRLGDLKIGDIAVHVPTDRAVFQGEFDLRNSKGFVLRVSAGIDTASHTASWVLQAIDPETGEVLADATRGLLAPNDGLGRGAGYVSFTAQSAFDAPTGATIRESARVILNTQAPVDTNEVVRTLDGSAPATTVTATLVAQGGADYDVHWTASDEPGGSGVKHTTVYVSEDGGDWKIWKRQTTETSGVYEGQAGHTYQFLALSTDNAGNRETAPRGTHAPDDGSRPAVGIAPTVSGTTQDVGVPPTPSTEPSTNPLFTQAEAGIPSTPPDKPSEFTQVLAPFVGAQFGTGIGQSEAHIGPLALLAQPDGTFVASGGANRGSLYRFPQDGGRALNAFATLSKPIFDLAYDQHGELWATSGGGQLLQLDPSTGAVLASYGDSLTQSLALDPATGKLYVSSGDGIERFDPVTRTFSHFSNVRVDDLAVADDGKLWGTSWPKRGDVLKFDNRGRAQVMLRFDADLDSLAFGAKGTQLEGLLFVGAKQRVGDEQGASLYMVDFATLRSVQVATGGPGAENLIATSDGRLLVANADRVDVIAPIIAPKVVRTSPADGGLVLLPQDVVSVTFDQPMATSGASSVLDAANYSVLRDGNAVPVTQLRYEADSRTVFLGFERFDAGLYEVHVSAALRSVAGLSLDAPYVLHFTAASDFSANVRIDFADTRSDRAADTVSYDVRITNIGGYDLRAPLVLVLDPQRYFAGRPDAPAVQNDAGLWLLDLTPGLMDERLRAGETTTVETITVRNPLLQRANIGHSVYALPYANERPAFDSTPQTAAVAGEPYRYEAHATDPDGVAIAYLLMQGPQGMTIDPSSGVVAWSPTSDSPDQASVTLRAYDSRGGYAAQSFVVDVAGGNHAPQLGALPDEYKLREGVRFEAVIKASDADGDPVATFIDRLPPGATFDPSTHLFTWTPGFDQAGIYRDVRIAATDGLRTSEHIVSFSVEPGNAAPVIHAVPDRVVREGDPIRIAFSADDPDGNLVTFSSPFLPGGAFLDPNTGVFEWTPGFNQAGVYAVPIQASDGEAMSEKTVTLTVTNVNGAPVFDQLQAIGTLEGQTVSFRAFAADPDNPGFVPQDRLADGSLTVLEGSEASVTYSVSGLPSGASFDPVTAMFRWTPGYDQAGSYTVRFSATDDGDGTGVPITSIVDVPIVVANANRAPELAEIHTIHVAKGDVSNVQITATDADGDPLTLSIAGLPRFASFTDAGDGTGTLHLAPGERDRGDYVVKLTVADDGDGGGPKAVLSASRTFVISAESASEAPLLAPVGDKVAVVGKTLRLTLRASDLDQDALAFSSDTLPAGATLTAGPGYGTAVFEWTPGAADRGAHSVRFVVTDDGNTGAGPVGSDEETISIVVRDANAAPVLLPVGPQQAHEGVPFVLALQAVDADNDPLTYSASNLPPGATLDARTGVVTWTPNLFQAGVYSGITVSASDGAATSSDTYTITVAQTNQAPLLALMPPLGGQEQRPLSFSLVGTDPDGDALLYSALTPLPRGAFFDGSNGLFEWTPDYDQAGSYQLRFAARDTSGASDTVDVSLAIADVNRAPAIKVTNHLAPLGERLAFRVGLSDLDSNETLSLSGEGLPEGATLDSATGDFAWTPGPGQAGDYLVLLNLTDGKTTTTRPLVLRATQIAQLPDVAIELTPSFPAIPGQQVSIAVLGDAFSAITAKSLTIDGRPAALDEHGRAVFTASAIGLVHLVATATDVDGFVGRAEKTLKVRDAADQAAPVVSFGAAVPGAIVSAPLEIAATVADSNLDYWTLEIARYGTDAFSTLATGTTSVANAALATLDPGAFENGPYRLRLTAADIAGRMGEVETTLELRSTAKTERYAREETDFNATLAGHALDFTRRYDSQAADLEGSFGFGWRLAFRDVSLVTDLPGTGRESFGAYAPLREGTRLFLTLPSGERAGFTFAPEQVNVAGIRWYQPRWIADDGVAWTLTSADAKLQRASDRYRDRAAIQPRGARHLRAVHADRSAGNALRDRCGARRDRHRVRRRRAPHGERQRRARVERRGHPLHPRPGRRNRTRRGSGRPHLHLLLRRRRQSDGGKRRAGVACRALRLWRDAPFVARFRCG
jgi:subtilase family serine protease